MENMGNMDAEPPGAAAQNLVGSVDYMSLMYRHASAVSNNPISMDASMKPSTSNRKLFPNATLPPNMNPTRVTPDRSKMYQSVSSQPKDAPIHSYMSTAASTVMETFQSDMDDVTEDIQELENGM
jgi:hypothetical protein